MDKLKENKESWNLTDLFKSKEEFHKAVKQMQEDLSHEVIDIAMVAASKIVNREINESDNEKMIEEFLKEDFKP